MKIKELIEDLQAELYYWGNIDVRVDFPDNRLVVGSTRAKFLDNGQMTLFLHVEGGE